MAIPIFPKDKHNESSTSLPKKLPPLERVTDVQSTLGELSSGTENVRLTDYLVTPNLRPPLKRQ